MIVTDITGRCNIRIQNLYTCTTPLDKCHVPLRWSAPDSSANTKIWNKLLFIAMHYSVYTSLEVKGWWGLLLPQLKYSSDSIIWMCRASFIKCGSCCWLQLQWLFLASLCCVKLPCHCPQHSIPGNTPVSWGGVPLDSTESPTHDWYSYNWYAYGGDMHNNILTASCRFCLLYHGSCKLMFPISCLVYITAC